MVDLLFPGPSVRTSLAIGNGALDANEGRGLSRMTGGHKIPEGTGGQVRAAQCDGTAAQVAAAAFTWVGQAGRWRTRVGEREFWNQTVQIPTLATATRVTCLSL